MSKTALVLLVPGAEEMEFVVSVDVLRRAGVCSHQLQQIYKIYIFSLTQHNESCMLYIDLGNNNCS